MIIMKPIIRIVVKHYVLSQKFAAEYLHVTKRFLLPDKKEWKPYIHYSGLPDDLFWFESLESLQNDLLRNIKVESISQFYKTGHYKESK